MRVVWEFPVHLFQLARFFMLLEFATCLFPRLNSCFTAIVVLTLIAYCFAERRKWIVSMLLRGLLRASFGIRYPCTRLTEKLALLRMPFMSTNITSPPHKRSEKS